MVTWSLVRGHNPKTNEWSLKGEVIVIIEVVYGQRSVNVALENSRGRLFIRDEMRKDSTKKYQEAKEEALKSQVVGTSLEAKKDEQFQETMNRERKARQRPNTEQTEPRRSSRLARKRMTMGGEGSTHETENLPYYMEVVEKGRAGRWQTASVGRCFVSRMQDFFITKSKIEKLHLYNKTSINEMNIY